MPDRRQPCRRAYRVIPGALRPGCRYRRPGSLLRPACFPLRAYGELLLFLRGAPLRCPEPCCGNLLLSLPRRHGLKDGRLLVNALTEVSELVLRGDGLGLEHAPRRREP